MAPFSLVSILFCAAAAFGFVNYRFIRLPGSVGVLIVALAASLLLVGVDKLSGGSAIHTWAQALLGEADLPRTLLGGTLAFMLFAGAMDLDLKHLRSRKWTILSLATIGVVLAMVLFGTGIWAVFRLTGAPLPYAWCLVLGAILAPTDPVAVADTLRRVGLPPTLEATIAGESLFNDGVAIVLFTAAYAVATGTSTTPAGVGVGFLREAGGGGVLGLLAGAVAFLLLREVDNYRLELMISLALASGTFSLATALGASGPIAVVVAGLLIGNQGVEYAMSETTRANLKLFWSLVDEILNTLLFLLIGLVIISVPVHLASLEAALIAIPLALVVRAISVIVPTLWLHLHTPNKRGAIAVLTWGGLRGGICVALALSLPPGEHRERILAVCYAVVLFTVIVQGLTLQRVIERFYGRRG